MGFKKDRGTNVLNEVIETLKEVIPEPEEQTTETTEAPEEKKTEAPEAKENIQVIPEVKKAAAKKTTKKKAATKEHTKAIVNCGIKGDTIEVRDFRAICKKNGKQINIVLNGIIAEWNHANYNL